MTMSTLRMRRRGPSRELEIGVETANLSPPFDRFYVQLGYGYSFLEKYRHVDLTEAR